MQKTTILPTALGVPTALVLNPTPASLPAPFEAHSDLTAPQPLAGVTLPLNFPVPLEPSQLQNVTARLAAFELEALTGAEVVKLGQENTEALNRTLDQFLARINKTETPQVFKLVDALSQEVEKERLGELAEQIMSAKPDMMTRLKGLFSKKSLQQGMDGVYEELGRAARKKSQALSDVIIGMERTLQAEMARLTEELQVLDALKLEYRKAFLGFAQDVAFLHNAVLKSKEQLPALLTKYGHDITRQQELQDAVQNLESVALSREAMMTRLPAEQLIIRQLQNAGVTTLQEIAITAGDRFASIRMTLIGIHGAHMVRGVQRLSQANATLDNQLQEARAKLMGTVVETAANMAGENRVAQAQNLQKVVSETQTLQAVVTAARDRNDVRFQEARATLASARKQLLELGGQINPAQSVSEQLSSRHTA